MLKRILAAVAALLCASGLADAANAATTMFPIAVFSSSGVTAPNGLLGNTLSVTEINRNASTGLQYGGDITKFTLSFEISSVTPQTTYLWVRFGRRVGATFTNALVSGLLAPNGSATQNLYVQIAGPGTYFINSVVYESGCAAIGGCNAIVFGNSTFSATGSRFGVSTVGATPEPSVWALMIVAFAGVGLRLKARRGEQRPTRRRRVPTLLVKPKILADLVLNP